MSLEIREIRLGEENYKYTLERKKVKNINLRIKPDKNIYVSANKRVSLRVIETFIKSKEAFILEAFRKFEKSAEIDTKIGYNIGDEIIYFGRKLELKIVKSLKEGVKASGESIYIFVKDVNDRAKKENLLKQWVLS